jgi:hypothetical protein
MSGLPLQQRSPLVVRCTQFAALARVSATLDSNVEAEPEARWLKRGESDG